MIAHRPSGNSTKDLTRWCGPACDGRYPPMSVAVFRCPISPERSTWVDMLRLCLSSSWGMSVMESPAGSKVCFSMREYETDRRHAEETRRT